MQVTYPSELAIKQRLYSVFGTKCSITPYVQAFSNSNESNSFWRENLAPWLNEKMAKKIKRKRKNVACCHPNVAFWDRLHFLKLVFIFTPYLRTEN